jgi:hypothetical protein
MGNGVWAEAPSLRASASASPDVATRLSAQARRRIRFTLHLEGPSWA